MQALVYIGHTKGGSMQQLTINPKSVNDSVLPELTTLKALLTGLNLSKSLKVLSFLQYVLDLEINELINSMNKKQPPKHV